MLKSMNKYQFESFWSIEMILTFCSNSFVLLHACLPTFAFSVIYIYTRTNRWFRVSYTSILPALSLYLEPRMIAPCLSPLLVAEKPHISDKPHIIEKKLAFDRAEKTARDESQQNPVAVTTSDEPVIHERLQPIGAPAEDIVEEAPPGD